MSNSTGIRLFINFKGIFDYTNLDSDSVNVLGMCTCARVHDKLSCACLQNYTIGIPTMYPNPDF